MTSGHYCDGCARAYYKCVCDKQEEPVAPVTIPKEQFDMVMLKATIELMQRVNRMIELLEKQSGETKCTN